jgi:hypothetical protein
LEIVRVAGLGLDLSPLPNRTTSAFDFRRHQFEYARTAVAIKPKSSSPIIVVGMNPHIRPDLLVFSLIICTAARIALSYTTGISAPLMDASRAKS